MEEFSKFSDIEKESNQEKSKVESLIDLCCDTFLMHFSFYVTINLGGDTFFRFNVSYLFT